MKWHQRNEYYWVRDCGRFFVERSFSADRWVHLGWFKRDRETLAECISPKARKSLHAARADCAAHPQFEQQPRQDAA